MSGCVMQSLVPIYGLRRQAAGFETGRQRTGGRSLNGQAKNGRQALKRAGKVSAATVLA